VVALNSNRELPSWTALLIAAPNNRITALHVPAQEAVHNRASLEARGLAFAQQIEAGMTHINDITIHDYPHMMFGGQKNSGLGRFNGRWIVEEFTTDHFISVQR
jgi:acyl-CoA reductase-like NAD-dependent aldehyde dehydrogenase